MIINALCDYYKILAEDDDSGIPLQGYSKGKVSFALTLSPEGKILEITDLQVKASKGNKTYPKDMIVPEQPKRSGKNPPAYFLCDKSLYVFGIEINKKSLEIKPERFELFKALHSEILGDSDDPGARALLTFLKNWNPETALDQLKDVIGFSEEMLGASNFVFMLDGENGYLHNRKAIKEIWETSLSQKIEGFKGQCLVSGKTTSIAKLHPNLKGVRGAQSAGAALVSFNATAFVSYGKDQSYNAPVGESTCFDYATALNHILQKENQKIFIGDTTCVFWAESPNEIYNNLAFQLFNPTNEKEEEEEKEGSQQDKKMEKEIHSFLKAVKAGKKVTDVSNEIKEETKFYILGLSPNNARVAVRFFHQDTFGGFTEKLGQHYRDMEIEGIPAGRSIPLWQIIGETTLREAKEKKPSSLLAGNLMRSIITGGLYPQELYMSMIRRIRAEQDKRDQKPAVYSVNYTRVAMIKAYLLRKSRLQNDDKTMEVLTVSLNEDSKNNAYLLGRLFAYLEKAQEAASGGELNATIKNRYFSTASATPRAVFPILMKLNNHHLNKLAEKGKWLEIEIGKIMDGIDLSNNFPAHLSLEDQGVFVLGYYHQRQTFFRTKEERAKAKEEKATV